MKMLTTKPKHTMVCPSLFGRANISLIDSSNGLFKDTKEECMNKFVPGSV